MPSFFKKYSLIVLLVFSVPLFFLNIQKGHTMGGDDHAMYIKEAKNIAEGKPYYASNYIFNPYNNCYSPPSYPPGYPLLLSPIVKQWGVNYMAFCYFNTLVAVALLFCFFIFFKKYMSEVAAICVAVLITYSGILIDLKQSVLSDVSSLLFIMLYLITRNANSIKKWPQIALLILFATMAVLIRTQAILLIVAEVLFLCLEFGRASITAKKVSIGQIRYSHVLFVVPGFVLLNLIMNKVIFYAPALASGFYIAFLKDTLGKGLLTVVRDNVNFFLESVTGLFHYKTDNSIRTALVTFTESTGLVFCFIGFFISVTKRVTYNDVFFLLMCGLVLYYPIHDGRYFLPAIAIVYYYCYVALSKILPVITKQKGRNIGIALTIANLIVGFRYLKGTMEYTEGHAPAVKDMQAFDYIKSHVLDSEIILCARPRLTTLYTDKKCVIHAWQHSMTDNKKVFDSMKVKYVLLNGIVDDYYHTYLNGYQHPIDSVQIAEGYMLYTLR